MYNTYRNIALLLFGLVLASTATANSLHQLLIKSGQNWQFSSGQTQTQLIELYTSQGCSSCPPADRWLGDFKDNPELWSQYVPVAFHVDYWDYIGWPDQFAKPANSQRQRRYKAEGHTRSVYTPQFLVNGREWRGFFFPSLRGTKLPETKALPGQLNLNTTFQDQGLQVRANFKPQSAAQEASGHRYRLHLALLGANLKTAIKSGENQGRTLTHNFVVLQHQQYPLTGNNLSLEEFFTIKPRPQLPQHSELALAAWLVTPNNEVVQATGGWLQFTPK